MPQHPQQQHMHAHPSLELMPHVQPPQLMHTGANGMVSGPGMMPPPGMPHSAGRPMMMSQQYAAQPLPAATGGHSAPSSAQGTKGVKTVLRGCSTLPLKGGV